MGMKMKISSRRFTHFSTRPNRSISGCSRCTRGLSLQAGSSARSSAGWGGHATRASVRPALISCHCSSPLSAQCLTLQGCRHHQCCSVSCGAPVVCPGGAALAKSDAELDIMRLESKLLHPHNRSAGPVAGVHSMLCLSQHTTVAGHFSQASHDKAAACNGSSLSPLPCSSLLHQPPTHFEEEQVVAV